MPILDLWLLVDSQLTAIALADGRVLWQGLDYARAQAGFALAAIAIAPPLWAGVRIVERAAIAALNGAGA